MQKTKKLLSMLLALVMVFAVAAPVFAEGDGKPTDGGKQNEVTTTKSVTLHKILLTKEALNKHNKDKVYNGKTINNIQEFFGDNTAKEIAGAYFALKFAKDFEIPEGNNTITESDVKAGKAYVKAETGNKLKPAVPLTSTTNIEEAVAGLTTANGIKFVTENLKGKFEIDEIHEKSEYVGEAYFDDKGNELTKKIENGTTKYVNSNGEEVTNVKIKKLTALTSMKAVPVEITLPLVNNDGIVDEAHVYPKNTDDRVKIDKDHATYDEKNETWVDKDGKKVASSDLGAKYEKYEQEKKTLSIQLGKDKKYDSKTEIPKDYRFKEFSWQDVMSEGLTFNKDLVVTIDYTKKNAQGTDEKVEGEVFINKTTNATFITRQDDSGFDINVKKEQVKDTLVEYLKNGPVTFHFSYSAKANNKAVVDKPQSNSITFKPGEPNGGGKVTPGPDKSITVNKTWGDGNAEPTVTEVTYYVVDSNGKGVASITLTNSNTTGQKLVAGPGIEFEVGAKWYSGKFTGLEANKEYTVREAVVGYDPTYTTTDAAGFLNINNKSNPDVLKPTEPKVEYHGKKFIKTNQDGKERLAGAEFYVTKKVKEEVEEGGTKTTKEVTKYLVATKTDAKAVTDAKTALDNAVKAYNELSADDQKGQKGTDAKNLINEKQEAYNAAFKANATAYTWGEKGDANVVVLTSDGEGKFEITGLEAGTYYLEEKTPPAGFAKRNDTPEFEVKEGTYNGESTEFKYELKLKDGETQTYGKQIVNKKVLIPQTGGIGTIIFAAVGIALMVSAVVAMKKREAEEI